MGNPKTKIQDVAQGLAALVNEATDAAPASHETLRFHDSLRGLVVQMPRYQGQLRKFIGFLEESGAPFNSPEAIRDAVREYKRVRKEDGKSPGTINVDLIAIRQLVREMLGRTETLPIKEARLIKATLIEEPFKMVSKDSAIPDDKVLSPEEIRQLLEGTTEKIGLVIEFLYATWARVSEATSIKLTDPRPSNGHFLINVVGKGGKRRDLPPVSKELIGRIREHFQGETFLFETRGESRKPYRREYLYAQIRKQAERILGRKVGPHVFRHSTATRFYQITGSIKKTQILLGHSRPSITSDMYLHESYSDADVAALYGEIKGEQAEKPGPPGEPEQSRFIWEAGDVVVENKGRERRK